VSQRVRSARPRELPITLIISKGETCMTARRTGTGLALLVGAALLVVACSGAAGTTAPTTLAAATEAPASEAAPASGLPGFSFALPSFTSDAELEAKFPKELGGETLQILSMSGSDFLGSGMSGNEIGPILQQLGKAPSDLSVAVGGTTSISVIAFRIKGVPADQFLNAYTSQAQQGAAITDASFGGKSVKKVVASGQDPVYLYLKDDVIWTVGGSGPTDALLNEAFSKLP
jgi:hypothetical protein